jgi:8-oxo-dGTP diphosphatase
MPLHKITIVARLILEKEGRVLLLAQTVKNGGKFSLVGGKVESKEMATEALVRETFEEAGVEVLKENLELVHVLQRKKIDETIMVLYFKATIWKGDAFAKEKKKFANIYWAPLNLLPENITPVTKKVLQSYAKQGFFTEYDDRKQMQSVK